MLDASHPYMGLLEPESEEERLALESQIPADAVMVTGPQGCGNRLAAAILVAGGFPAWLDNHHGLVRRPVDRVVVTKRNRDDASASAARNFHPDDIIAPEISEASASEFYPDAYTLDYDLLCSDPGVVLADLAEWLGVEPWPSPVPIIPSLWSKP